MDLEKRIQEILTGRKMVMLLTIAEECGISELEAARALPEKMRAFCAEEQFNAVWSDLVQWPSATFIMRHGGSVIEIKGKIPNGKEGGGYFNLESGSPLGGHIRHDQVTDICFLSMPFMGLESHSIQFFDAQGAVLFSVYVGREKRELIPEALNSFLSMRNKFCKE